MKYDVILGGEGGVSQIWRNMTGEGGEERGEVKIFDINMT